MMIDDDDDDDGDGDGDDDDDDGNDDDDDDADGLPVVVAVPGKAQAFVVYIYIWRVTMAITDLRIAGAKIRLFFKSKNGLEAAEIDPEPCDPDCQSSVQHPSTLLSPTPRWTISLSARRGSPRSPLCLNHRHGRHRLFLSHLSPRVDVMVIFWVNLDRHPFEISRSAVFQESAFISFLASSKKWMRGISPKSLAQHRAVLDIVV